MVALGYLPTLERSLRLAFGGHFLNDFFFRENLQKMFVCLLKSQRFATSVLFNVTEMVELLS